MRRDPVASGGRRIGSTALRNAAVVALAAGAMTVSAAGVMVIADGWNRTPLDWASSDRFLLGSQLLAAATTVPHASGVLGDAVPARPRAPAAGVSGRTDRGPGLTVLIG